MIDSHIHINSLVSNNINREVQKINNTPNLEAVINIGLNTNTSRQSLEISRSNPKFYTSVGIHPLYTKEENIDRLYDIAEDSRVVAIGEIGLDTTKNNYQEQKYYLIKQIILANELGLPVIIHSNNANQEIIQIFKTIIKPKYGCVFHCFQPDLETLKYLIDNNYYISFAGRITYATANKSIEILKNVPEDLFLVETDSPYIKIGPQKNISSEPANLSYIIEQIARIKNKDPKEIETLTSNNTKKLFKKMN